MKKMRHMKRKALVALVLSVTMLLTLMPGLVFGVSDDQGDPHTVSSSIDYPTVNFTDVAPFLPPVSGTAPRRSPARAAGDANTGSDNGNNGMAANKTAVYNEDTGAYDITLEEIDYSGTDSTRNMTVCITDPELLEVTGGIVQGMSGSPILQNGKLVGAVTHVFVDDPTRGYGIFCENMVRYGLSGS